MIEFKGVSGSVTTCECCGKPDLKKTVILDIDGQVIHYGTTCAGKAMGVKTTGVDSVRSAVDKTNKTAAMRLEVDGNRLIGGDKVIGRFYISRLSRESKTRVGSASDPLLAHQIYPSNRGAA